MGRDREILEIVARYCGKTSSIYRYIAQDIAALTREAAPQASGGDAHAWAVKYDADTFLAMQPMDVSRDFIAGWNTCRAHVMAQKYIATPDSAIQSQQGATGGDKLPCSDSDNCRRCSEDADTPHSGIPRGSPTTRTLPNA